MAEAIRKVNVIGHLHPDTDSICSAISYAYLKNQISEPIYEARRAGAINRETAFVLKHFGFEEPPLITTVTPQIKDIKITPLPGIDAETSLFTAWNLMRDEKAGTLCIVDDRRDLKGLIAVRDIANANMDILDTEVLATSRTRYENILSTLDATMVLGDPEQVITSGKMCVGTTPEMMEDMVEEGDIVLCTNRYETQQFAVDCGAQCLIICCDAHVSPRVVASAERNGCAIIATPYDTYAAARLVTMSIPVRAKMLPSDKILRFSVNTSIDDAQKSMAATQHRVFPVTDENGLYCGVVSSANMIDVRRKHVILVDHNERSQAVDGLEQAEIMEIVDHHRIGSIETDGPVVFRNEPVGCTCTIIYSIFKENDVEIPANIAGLMMSAILSDTLCFRSPTEEVFNSDFKVFSRGNVRFGVGQGSFMTENSRRAAEKLVGPYLSEGAAANEIPLVFYLFTDVKTQTSDLLYWGDNAEEVIEHAFGVQPEDGIAVLEGVVSRKKQVTPPLMSTLQSFSEEE